jgi:ornithine cyclodeaminase
VVDHVSTAAEEAGEVIHAVGTGLLDHGLLADLGPALRPPRR